METLPLTMAVLDRAASLWAEARLDGYVHPRGVDVDMLVLAHQEIQKESYPGRRVVIATKNLKDFRRFNENDAEVWQNIRI
jgi:hypothetical protein